MPIIIICITLLSEIAIRNIRRHLGYYVGEYYSIFTLRAIRSVLMHGLYIVAYYARIKHAVRVKDVLDALNDLENGKDVSPFSVVYIVTYTTLPNFFRMVITDAGVAIRIPVAIKKNKEALNAKLIDILNCAGDSHE